jgi:hypothetical protein
MALIPLFMGNFTLWYDPARDLLSAWDNLMKPTLIGPTSGIPGLFYGPYWIWLLSFGLLFSKNPIIVTLITATLPYFILFPFIWFRLSKLFDKTSLILGWLLLMLGNGMIYATQLWNPYPAPLITLAAIALLISTNLEKLKKSTFFALFFVGILLGLVVNFHISFGISLLLGTAIFYLVDSFVAYKQANKKDHLKILRTRSLFAGTIIIGIVVAFIPTLLFEMRHGFHQMQTLLHTFSKYGAVVGLKGLSKAEIFQEFLHTFGKLLHVPSIFAGILFLMLIILLGYSFKKKKALTVYNESRILFLSFSLLLGDIFIYFSAKNPVWQYHFIGVDIILLIFVTYCSTKFSIFRKVLVVWTFIIVVSSIVTFVQSIKTDQTFFQQQQTIVRTITVDAKKNDYTVYAYSPSIYIYDYSYLFRWLAQKDIPYDPGQIKVASNIVYLIVPPNINSTVVDFIHFRAPIQKYTVVKTWHISGNVEVIKNEERQKIKKG